MGFSHWAIETCNATMPSATFFKATADAFVRLGLKDAGYEYLQIDGCWMLAERGTEGQQIVDPTKFPDGMLSLASYVHELGLRLGIYTAMGSKTCAQKAGPTTYLVLFLWSLGFFWGF
jgi:alpha-galactosidase